MENIVYDGHTKTNINNLPDEAWEYLRGEGQDSGLKKIQKSVPWLYRGMNIRALSVASVPFSIYKGEVEYDTSDDWQNKIEFMPDPWKLLQQLEMAMTLFNYSYLLKSNNKFGFTKELRYLMPLTMKPIISESGGLESFERTLRGKKIPLTLEEIAYFWGIDPYIEIGHPQSSPATAAMAAAGVLMSVDEFAAAFFERGAIKATILGVPQGTQKSERDALSNWYSGIMTGLKNAFSTKVLNADAVTATVIGEGIEGLENTNLTKEKREDISTALGIPQSKLFSTSATDSNRVEDEKAYLNDLIIPQTRLYEGIFNSQIFEDMGLRWKFRPQEMSVLQEDEKERSEAMLNYVMAGLSQTVSAAILGVDVPEGFTIEDKEEPVEDDKQDMREFRQEAIRLVAIGNKLDEKRKFHRFMKNGKDIDKFTFNFLDETEQDAEKEQYAHIESDMLLKSLTDSLDALRDIAGENNAGEIVVPDEKPAGGG